jgi:Tfp pilus assembly protein PilF
VLNPARNSLPGEDPMKKAQRDVNMARRLYEIGQYADAVKFANKALVIAPVGHAWTVMGQSYVKLKNCPAAKKAFDQAVKIDPGEANVVAASRTACR